MCWRTLVFNCINGRPCHHIIIWIQCPTFPSLDLSFSCSNESKCLPMTRCSKAIHQNMVVPLLKYRNKWASALHMDKYYDLGMTTIPYLGFDCILTMDSKKKRTYLMCFVDKSRALALTLQRNVVNGSGEEGVSRFPINICIMCLGICARVTTPPISLFMHPSLDTMR